MISQIRQSIFETNSSSTHVLSVTSCSMDTINIPETIEIDTNMEFGWYHDTFNDPCSKLSYLYLVLSNNEEQDRLFAFLSVVGCKVIKTGKDQGYIDHSYEAKEFAKKLLDNPDILYAFIFNDQSFIETGNDNDEYLTDKYSYDEDEDEYGINKKKIPGDYVYIKYN